MSGTYEPGLGWVPDTPDMYAAQNGIDFGGGWSQTLQDFGRIALNTWSQSYLMQQNQDGQRYIEGQRLAALQNGVGGINLNTLLLIGVAVGAFMLLKD